MIAETRTVEVIDTDLKMLTLVLPDILRGSKQWEQAWDRIDALLEERLENREKTEESSPA